MNPKPFQHLINIRFKNEPLHVARGPFLVQRTTFLVQRAKFLRPLDERRPQSAKKVSALNALGSPRRAFLVQKREEIAQGHSKGSKNPENAIPKSMEKIRPKTYTKFIPKAFQNHAKTDTKIIDLFYFCEKG